LPDFLWAAPAEASVIVTQALNPFVT
jgi:hypothetical protein